MLRFTSNCVLLRVPALLLLPKKVGAGDVIHGGNDSRREYRAFEQWRDDIYYVVGYIQILATFTNAGTSSVYSDTAAAVV